MSFRLKAPTLHVTEKHVAKACLHVLQLRGYFPVRLQSGVWKSLDATRTRRMGFPGLPDYVAAHALYPAVFLETKSPKGKVSIVQEQTIWGMRASGLAVVAVSDAGALDAWLDEHEAAARKRWASGP